MSRKSVMTGIWFALDPETNQRLELSARENKRTKRQEAHFRLRDHLQRFDEKLKSRPKS